MEFLKYKNFEYIKKVPSVEKEKYPAILLLHGAGSRGNDIRELLNNPAFAEESLIKKDDFPFILFAPQCFANSWFDIFEQLQEFAKWIAADPMVDKQRVYLMGASMGGYATWQLAMSIPEVFAAIIPICGGGMYWNVWQLHDVPVWAVHGKDDEVVLPRESEKMVEVMLSQNSNAKLTLLDNVAHDSWNYVYKSEFFFDWLLSHKKSVIRSEETDAFSGSKKFG